MCPARYTTAADAEAETSGAHGWGAGGKRLPNLVCEAVGRTLEGTFNSVITEL